MRRIALSRPLKPVYLKALCFNKALNNSYAVGFDDTLPM